jgi:hypothetical protein
MIIYLDEAFHAYQRAGRMKTQHDLFEAITYGAVQRVRPKLMTVCMITFGLVPALWAHGAGAEAIQRIAAPMIGGLITSTILTLEIVPAIYSLWRGRQVQWVKGPRPARKSWSELSHEFVEMERAGHHDGVMNTAALPAAAATVQHAGSETGVPPIPKRRAKWLWGLVAVAVVAGIVFWLSRGSGPERVSNGTDATDGTKGRKPSVTQAKLELSDAQTKAAQAFMTAAATVSESLAADDLAEFNRAVPQIARALNTLLQTLPADHGWRPLLQKLADNGKLVPAGDLAEARKEFIAFSAATTDFVKAARQQNAALGSLKIYRCPMAPQPGFWMQLHGPIRNPYFGSEMLDCGSEINP